MLLGPFRLSLSSPNHIHCLGFLAGIYIYLTTNSSLPTVEGWLAEVSLRTPRIRSFGTTWALPEWSRPQQIETSRENMVAKGRFVSKVLQRFCWMCTPQKEILSPKFCFFKHHIHAKISCWDAAIINVHGHLQESAGTFLGSRMSNTKCWFRCAWPRRDAGNHGAFYGGGFGERCSAWGPLMHEMWA